jgi:cytoskeletal protein RodZ
MTKRKEFILKFLKLLLVLLVLGLVGGIVYGFIMLEKSPANDKTNSNTNDNTSTTDSSTTPSSNTKESISPNSNVSPKPVTESYTKQSSYASCHNCGQCAYTPPGYHRYGSNTCDPTQDELPITMPDPNEGLDPLNADPLWLSIQTGSAGCGTPGRLNFCQ